MYESRYFKIYTTKTYTVTKHRYDTKDIWEKLKINTNKMEIIVKET